MSDKREKSSDNEMTFFEHIEALRPHLVRGVMALIVVMIAAFIGKKFIIDTILMGPQSPDFPTNRWLCDFSYAVFGDNRVCINQMKFNMVNHGAGRPVQPAHAGGVGDRHCRGGTVPVVGDMAFCRAGADRTRTPQKQDVRAVCVALLFCRARFGYFLIAPLSVSFFAGYQASPEITNMIDVRSYLSTVLSVSIACAVVFQLPLLVYFLARMGLITASFLRRYRRHALILLSIISAIYPRQVFSACCWW